MGGRPRAGQNTSELGRGGCACWAEGSSPRPASRSWKRGTIGRRAGEEAALTLGGKGGEGGVVPGQRGGVRVLRAGQRVVVPREGGRGAQHAVGQLRAQVGAVGRGAHGHPVQGVGAAREGKVHPPVHQVLCGDRAGSLPQARPQTPEPRGAGCRSPGNSGGYLPTYLPGPPWHQNTQPPSAHQGQRPLEESTAQPTPAGFWNTGPLAWQEAPTDPTSAGASQPQQSAPPWGEPTRLPWGPLALGSPGKAAWPRWALAGAEVGAGGGVPVTSLPAGAPRAPIGPMGGAISRGPGVGGAPAAGGQARDELRGQPPRDAPQVQLLPQQGLELPAAALGTTKGRVGTARGRRGRGEEASGPPAHAIWVCGGGGTRRQAGPSARRCYRAAWAAAGEGRPPGPESWLCREP